MVTGLHTASDVAVAAAAVYSIDAFNKQDVMGRHNLSDVGVGLRYSYSVDALHEVITPHTRSLVAVGAMPSYTPLLRAQVVVVAQMLLLAMVHSDTRYCEEAVQWVHDAQTPLDEPVHGDAKYSSALLQLVGQL